MHFNFDREDFQLWTVTLLTHRWHWEVLIPATAQGGGVFNFSTSYVFLIYGAPRPATCEESKVRTASMAAVNSKLKMLIRYHRMLKKNMKYTGEMLSTSRIMWKSSICLAIGNLQQSANKLRTIKHWYVSFILKQWYSFMFRTLQIHQQGIYRVFFFTKHI